MKPVISTALIMASALVYRATENDGLASQLGDLLERDPDGRRLLEGVVFPISGGVDRPSWRRDARTILNAAPGLQQRVAIFLVERTLRPAWQLFHVVPLLQRDPSRVYEEFAASAERDARAQLLELEARRLRPDPSTPEERRRVRDLLERLEAMSRIPPGT